MPAGSDQRLSRSDVPALQLNLEVYSKQLLPKSSNKVAAQDDVYLLL